MDFMLTDDQKMIRDTAKEFSDEVLAVEAAEYDEKDEPNLSAIKKLGELGYMGITIPEKYGGAGLDTISYALVMEQMARGCAATATTISIQLSLVAEGFIKYGSEEQRKKYLPKLATGEVIGAFAMTEPSAGSDVGSMTTSGVKKGDDYVINGTKTFITNGGFADLFLLFVSTDKEAGAKGLSCLIVEKDTPGFRLGKKEVKMGIRATDTRELIFEDCKVPKTDLLGEEGKGMSIGLGLLDGGRIGIAAQATGIAQRALEEATSYSKEREQFGRPICKFQAIQFMLADMAMRVDAARLLTLRSAWAKDAGKPYSLEAATAKLYASETANWVADKALQIHGGYGYMKEYVVERLYRDARITEIYEGTSEIQRLVISGHLLKD